MVYRNGAMTYWCAGQTLMKRIRACGTQHVEYVRSELNVWEALRNQLGECKFIDNPQV